MAERKSVEERIKEIERKQEQLKAQQKELQHRYSEEKRKKRTRRLIELGGVVESVLGRETVDEDKKRLLIFLNKQEQNGKYFTRAMNSSEEVGEAE